MPLPGLRFCLALVSALPGLAAPIGKHDARDAAECRAQVESNFQAIARNMAASGNYHGIASVWRRWREPAMAECGQMERIERMRRMRRVDERLEAAIRRLRSDGALGDEERRWLAREHAAIREFPHSPLRDAHLALYALYERHAAPVPPSSGQCPDILRALKSARTEHDLAVDALLRREPEWRVHEQVRQAALSEMQFQQFLAQRAACRLK